MGKEREKAKAKAIVKENWNGLSESTKQSAVFSTAAQYGTEGIKAINEALVKAILLSQLVQ